MSRNSSLSSLSPIKKSRSPPLQPYSVYVIVFDLRIGNWSFLKGVVKHAVECMGIILNVALASTQYWQEEATAKVS